MREIRKMDLFRLVVLVLTLSFMATPVSAVCGGLASGTLYYIPVNIPAPNSGSYTTNTQMFITLNTLQYGPYLANDLQNIYIENSISCNTVPTWVEAFNGLNENQANGLTNNALIEFKNPDNAAGAENGVYVIGVEATGNNLYGNTIAQLGAAPQFFCGGGTCPTTVWGGVDNSNSVNVYGNNFTQPSYIGGWITGSASATSANGLTLTTSGSCGSFGWCGITYPKSFFGSIPVIVEAYGKQTNANNGGLGAGGSNSQTPGSSSNQFDPLIQVIQDGSGAGWYLSNSNFHTSTYALAQSQYAKFRVVAQSSSIAANVFVNGLQGDGTITGSEVNSPYYPTLGSGNSGVAEFWDWIIIRLCAPGCVAPAITTGTIQPTASQTLVFGANPITYGSSTTVTATCIPSTDTCDVDLPLGTHLCTGTGTCTYTIPNYPAAGTYTYYANDITLNLNVNSILTVNTAPEFPTCTYNGYSISIAQVIRALLATAPIVCNVNTVSNQVTTSNLQYNGITVGTGNTVSYTQTWDNLLDTGNFVVPATANYIGNYLPFSVNNVEYNLISASPTSGNFYETQTNNFVYVINVTKAASTANVLLYANSVFYGYNSQSVSATAQQTFTLPYTAPLTSTNNIANVYNGQLNAFIVANGYTLGSGNFNSVTINSLFNYVPKFTCQNANIIEGQSQTCNVIVNDVQSLNKSTYSGNLAIGTQTNILESILANYNYFHIFASFINSAFGISMPNVNAPVNVVANAIIKLSFNSNSVWRNQTLTFNSYQPSVGACSNSIYSGGNSIIWAWQTIPNQTIYAPNVFFTGFYQIVSGGYSYTVNGINAGLPPLGTATSNTYCTAVYPSFANLTVNGAFTYNAGAFATAGYNLMSLSISKTIQTIILNLETIINPEQFQFFLLNQSTGEYLPGTIQILQQLPNSNTTVIVNEIQTAAGQGANAYLQPGTKYKFAVFGTNNKLITINPLGNYYTAGACAAQPCSYIIPIGNSSINLLSQQLGNLNYGCLPVQFVNQTSTHPYNYSTIVTCSFASINGSTYTANLQIRPDTILNLSTSCSKTITSTTGSMNCTVYGDNNTIYNWQFSVQIAGSYVPVQYGKFGTNTNLLGNDGIFWGLTILIFFMLVYISKNVFATIILEDIAVIFVYVTKLLIISIASILLLQFIMVIVLYIITVRRNE